jgi:hypothetical protein
VAGFVVAFYFPHCFVCSKRLRAYVVRIWPTCSQRLSVIRTSGGQMSTSSSNIHVMHTETTNFYIFFVNAISFQLITSKRTVQVLFL